MQGGRRYLGWELLHLGRLILAYFIVLPIIVVLSPITILGNALGVAYNELRRW